MGDEHDSWFKNAFGIDLGKAVDKIKDEVSAAASAVSHVAGKVQGAVEEVPAAGAAGSFPLGGSVGRGGKNAASDVRAVQAALGVPADGDCGPKTVAAIKAYQKEMGQAKPDGRVDAGGATERALAAGTTPMAVLPADHQPSIATYHIENAWPAKSYSGGTVAGTIVDGDLVDALREQRAALEQSLKNAGSDADREQIQQELDGVDAEIASERWASEAAAAIEDSQGPEAQAKAEAMRELNPQLEQRYLTAEGSFTQAQLDARRIQRGLRAARKGVAAAGTLWATDDVGLAEVVGAATGALGSLANPPAIPVTGPSTVPPPSAPNRSDPIGVDVSGRSQGKAKGP